MDDFGLKLDNNGNYTFVKNGFKFENSLANVYKNSSETKSEILPPVTRYLDYAKGIVVIERPPTVRKIRFKNAAKNKDGELKFYTIPVPWQVYLHIRSATYAFFSWHQLESLNDKLFQVWLPNMTNDNMFCLGQYGRLHKNPEISGSPIQRILFDINYYWTSIFNLNAYHTSLLPLPESLKFQRRLLGMDGIIDQKKILEVLETLSLNDVLNPDFYKDIHDTYRLSSIINAPGYRFLSNGDTYLSLIHFLQAQPNPKTVLVKSEPKLLAEQPF